MLKFILVAVCAMAVSAAALANEESPIHWQPLREPGCGGWMTAIRVSPHDSNRILLGGDMLGIGLSEDRGESWQPTFGLLAYEMADFTFHPTDPNVVWAGSMSGPYISRDGGRNWQIKRNGMPPMAQGAGYITPIEIVLFDPTNHDRLLAFGGNSRNWSSLGEPLHGVIWESLDAGENWTRLTTLVDDGSDPSAHRGRRITAAEFAGADGRRVYAIGDAHFYFSDDGGRTWQRGADGLPGGGFRRMAIHPTDPNTIWLGVDNHLPEGAEQRVAGGVFKSNDGGRTWIEKSEGIAKHVTGKDSNLTTRIDAIAVSPTNPNLLYCGDTAWNTGIVYRSDDGGETWRPIVTKQNFGHEEMTRREIAQLSTAYPAGLALSMVVFDPNDENAVFGFGSEFVARTLDGGKTWDDATSIYMGDGRWRGRGYSGLCTLSFTFNPYRQGQAIAQAMDAANVWISDDDLTSWKHHHPRHTPWSGGTDATFTRDGRIYANSGAHGWMGIGRSDDGGQTWRWFDGQSHGLPEAPAWGRHNTAAIHAHPDRSDLVLSVIGGALYRSQDGGEHWSQALSAPHANWIAGDPNSPDTVYVSTARGLYQSRDFGGTFQFLGGPRNNGRIAVDSLGRVLQAAHQGDRPGVWRYEKGTWRRLLNEPWVYGIAVDPANPDRLIVTTNQNPYIDRNRATGAWISADGGRTWSQENRGLAMLRAYNVTFDPHNPQRVVYGANGRGFFIANWPAEYKPVGTRAYESTPADAEHALPQAVNIRIRNGSMDEVDEDDPAKRPLHWTGSWHSHGELRIARDTTIHRSEPASLSVHAVDNAKGNAHQVIDARGGEELRVSGWVRSEGQVDVNFAVQCFSDNWQSIDFKQIRFLRGTHDWQQATSDIKLPPGTAHVHVLLLVEGTGRAWLDDVKVTAIGP